eukprot:5933732-Alexandrium_andersonii.AAC.1
MVHGSRTPEGARGTLNMQHCLRRSELGLRGPRNSLKSGPRRSQGVHFAPLFAQIPNLRAKAGIDV